jgi:hypothetical protein
MKNLIANAWADFASNVIPPDAGAQQIENARQIYYAGAVAAFEAIVRPGDDVLKPSQASERLAQTVSVINALHDELGEHARLTLTRMAGSDAAPGKH